MPESAINNVRIKTFLARCEQVGADDAKKYAPYSELVKPTNVFTNCHNFTHNYAKYRSPDCKTHETACQYTDFLEYPARAGVVVFVRGGQIYHSGVLLNTNPKKMLYHYIIDVGIVRSLISENHTLDTYDHRFNLGDSKSRVACLHYFKFPEKREPTTKRKVEVDFDDPIKKNSFIIALYNHDTPDPGPDGIDPWYRLHKLNDESNLDFNQYIKHNMEEIKYHLEEGWGHP